MNSREHIASGFFKVRIKCKQKQPLRFRNSKDQQMDLRTIQIRSKAQFSTD
jgi:hypothetical protein